MITVLTNGASYTCTVTATNAIGTSAPSPPSAPVTPFVSAPGAPPTPTVARGDTKISVFFSAPSDNGGSPITGYRATCTGSGAPGSNTRRDVADHRVRSDERRDLHVHRDRDERARHEPAVASFRYRSAGAGARRAAATQVRSPTPAASPSRSRRPRATARRSRATPRPASRATAVCPRRATGPGSPITVTGVSNGRTYTCSVTATSAVGTGPPSPPSSPVVPSTVPAPPVLRGAGPARRSGNRQLHAEQQRRREHELPGRLHLEQQRRAGSRVGPDVTDHGARPQQRQDLPVQRPRDERDRRERPLGHFERVHRRHARRPRHRSRRIRVRDRVTGPAQRHVQSRTDQRQRGVRRTGRRAGKTSPACHSSVLRCDRRSRSATSSPGTDTRARSSRPTPVARARRRTRFTRSSARPRSRRSPTSCRSGTASSCPSGRPRAPAAAPSATTRCTAASSNGGKPSTSLLLVSPTVANNLTVGRTYSCSVAAVNARGARRAVHHRPVRRSRDPAAAGLPRHRRGSCRRRPGCSSRSRSSTLSRSARRSRTAPGPT